MDKNTKEFYILIAFYIIIVLLLYIPPLFFPFSKTGHINIISIIVSNFAGGLLYGSIEAIPFFIISILLLLKDRIHTGIFLLEIGTFLNSFNFLFIPFITFWQEFNPMVQSYPYGISFYLYFVYSILLIIFSLLMIIENKRKDFEEVISKYKRERNKIKIEQQKRMEYLSNLFIDKNLLNALKLGEKKLTREAFLNSLKNKRKSVEGLFDSGRYDAALIELKEIYTLFKFFSIQREQKWLNDKIMDLQYISIKKTILDLSLRFDRLELGEIAEKTIFKDETLIEKVIKKMISNKEIYAEYYENSRALLFNKQANIDEIDSLMETFKKWEKSEEKKI
ncbi:MAG: hypothetical protein EU550_00220 [Promethearchaeota archaeon]|nr:MAG: hypothetical protein EU550_00220 [Candidatus Lokiarchaeota archaeon]